MENLDSLSSIENYSKSRIIHQFLCPTTSSKFNMSSSEQAIQKSDIAKFFQNKTKLKCLVCHEEFENIFCSTSHLFLIDNVLCDICKEFNYIIIKNKQINIYSKINSLKTSISSSHQQPLVSSFNNKSGNIFPKTLEICCGDINPKFNNYYINVSENDILESIQKIIDSPLGDVKKVFALCLREILKYELSTIHEFYLKRSIEWKNWCDDIVIYFVCRRKIFGKKIPIANFDEECKPDCNCMDKY